MTGPRRWIADVPAMWRGLWRWARKLPKDEPGVHFGYTEGVRVTVVVFTALVTVETLVVHGVLLAIFGPAWWTWVVLAAGLYNCVWIFARYHAGMVVAPHVLDGEALRLRCGDIAEVVVPRGAIAAARPARHGRAGPGKLDLESRDDGTRTATFSNGGANVEVLLAAGTTITYRGEPVKAAVASLFVTADRPDELVRALREVARHAGDSLSTAALR